MTCKRSLHPPLVLRRRARLRCHHQCSVLIKRKVFVHSFLSTSQQWELLLAQVSVSAAAIGWAWRALIGSQSIWHIIQLASELLWQDFVRVCANKCVITYCTMMYWFTVCVCVCVYVALLVCWPIDRDGQYISLYSIYMDIHLKGYSTNVVLLGMWQQLHIFCSFGEASSSLRTFLIPFNIER